MSRACSYVVLCHTDPQAVLRLVARIRELSPAAGVLVRYDVAGLFAPGQVEAAGGVPWLSDVRVRWGDWSQVEMQLEVLEVAPRLVPADRFVFVSGQDYPIRHLASWEAELAAGSADAFFETMSPQPTDHRYRWRVLPEPAVGPDVAWRVLRAAGARLGELTVPGVHVYPVTRGGGTRWWIGTARRGGPPVPVLKASAWAVLSAHAVRRVLDTDRERPDVRAFFRTVRTPDEYYVPSLVLAAELRWSPRTVSAKRFAAGAASPAWVDAGVLAECAGAGKGAAFVRKVPPDVDLGVLATADRLAAADRPA